MGQEGRESDCVSQRSNNKPISAGSSHGSCKAALGFNAIHGYNRLVLRLPSLTLFAFQFCLIYLFHNTLQILVVPQAVEQQGSCFAAFGERPGTEGQRLFRKSKQEQAVAK